jgi:hypothetical protein
MSTVTQLGEARRSERDRSVSYRFRVAERESGTTYAELTVSHRKAGINYFTYEHTTEDYFGVSLRNVEVENERGFEVTKFQGMKGVGLARYEAGKRFSRKKLHEAAERGLALLTEMYESGDERVLQYFSEDAEA